MLRSLTMLWHTKGIIQQPSGKECPVSFRIRKESGFFVLVYRQWGALGREWDFKSNTIVGLTTI
jgi:hypothetical protein